MTAMHFEPILYGEQQLHAAYYAPSGEIRARVLLVTPLFEEKRCSHRALVTCACALAQAGVAVLQPDLYGTGNSRGMLTEIGLDCWMNNLTAAAAWLRKRAGLPIHVIGCRLGGLLAANAMADCLANGKLLLWQPAIAGRNYLHQARTRRMIQDKMTGDTSEIAECEVEGEVLSPELYAALETLAMPATLPAVDVRLLQCSFNERLLTEYQATVRKWGAENIRVRSIVAEPFWHPHTPGDYAELTTALIEEVMA